MTAEPFPVLSDDAEAVDVAVPRAHPVDELDSELERALSAPHELGLVELDQLIISFDRRDRRLADADDADGVAFDKLDVVEAVKELAEQGGCHPARGSAANDEDLVHRYRS